MTLYAFRLAPDSTSLDDAEVIDRSRYGWEFLDQATTLWRLIDPARADAIAAIKDRASDASDDLTRFAGDDLDALVRLLDGVDDAIVAAGIVDRDWRVPPERLAELARQVPAMDLTTERSLESKTHALGEVMINAVSLRNFLSDALRAGCIVVHD
ncbi:MAG: hypothetical protein ABIY55_04415 [Kofleriaceae bacterium]